MYIKVDCLWKLFRIVRITMLHSQCNQSCGRAKNIYLNVSVRIISSFNSIFNGAADSSSRLLHYSLVRSIIVERHHRPADDDRSSPRPTIRKQFRVWGGIGTTARFFAEREKREKKKKDAPFESLLPLAGSQVSREESLTPWHTSHSSTRERCTANITYARFSLYSLVARGQTACTS